jgi:GDP-L-fucose synthase
MGKILVTGGDGMLGTALKMLNYPDLIFISRKDADLTRFDETIKIFETIRPEAVIHLAAKVGGMGNNLAHVGELFRTNILINTNVLESARLVKVRKLISFLSTCAYPDKIDSSAKEEMLHDGPPYPGNYGYSYAKRMLDVQSRAYRQEWGCNFITAIPTNMYGPNDYWNLEEGHVIPSLIHKCFLAKKSEENFIVWGSGTALREFNFSEDVARLALWALKNYEEEDPINLSTGEEVQIRNLVELIADKMQFGGKLVWDKSKTDGQLRKPTDNTKLKSYLPNYEFTTIEHGIEKTIDWFVTNYPNVRM